MKINTIDKTFLNRHPGWQSDRAWKITLNDPVDLEIGDNVIEVKTFVLSSKNSGDSTETIIFPTDPNGNPYDHSGILGADGLKPHMAMNVFRSWLRDSKETQMDSEIDPL